MSTRRILFTIVLWLSSALVFGQGVLFNRLVKLEEKNPEKLEKVAGRYTNWLPKNPTGHFFLAKSYFKDFENTSEDKEKSKYLYKCLKSAYSTQKLDVKQKIITGEEWLQFKEQVKYEAHFFKKETSYTVDLAKISEKYYPFISNGEKDYLLESELHLKVPEDQKVDTLFYGLPTGKEYVKREFVQEELKMLKLINEEREKLGLIKMELDTSLSAACRYQAYDMGTQKYISHRGMDLGADGREYFANYTFDRIRQFYNETKLLGENISWGRDNAYYTYKGWYNSPGHNKIMFNPKNRLVGIGFVHIPGSEEEFYWVLCTAE